jgi:hypothetical protein
MNIMLCPAFFLLAMVRVRRFGEKRERAEKKKKTPNKRANKQSKTKKKTKPLQQNGVILIFVPTFYFHFYPPLLNSIFLFFFFSLKIFMLGL